MKRVAITVVTALIFTSNIYAAEPALREPDPGELDLTTQTGSMTNNEWAEAHRQFLESTNYFNRDIPASAPNNAPSAASVTGILTQDNSSVTDVTNTNLENLILYLYDMGYINTINGEFRGAGRLTRADFAYMMGSFVRQNNSLLQGRGFPTSRRTNVSFNDITESHSAYENLMELARRRIIHDTTSNIRPDAYITRLEAERWTRNLLDMLNFNRPIYFSFTNNITRFEMANVVMQLEMLINDGPVVSGNPLNIVRANTRNFSPYGFELHLTVNNSAVANNTNINFRIGETQSSVPLASLTPIAIFTHNTVYSVFVPQIFPGVHYVSAWLSIGANNSHVRVLRTEAILGHPNPFTQSNLSNVFGVGNTNFWNNNVNLNEWAWNNTNNVNNWWNWSSWFNSNIHNIHTDQWDRPDHRFAGWNIPESVRLNRYFHNNYNLGYRNNIIFGNSLIEAEVRRQLGFNSTDIITPADARRITQINITIPQTHLVSSRAFAGLEHFTNLHTLRFSFTSASAENRISSLSNLNDLRWLTSLRTVEARGHGISNLEAIRTLTNLEVLDLEMSTAIINNNISHINYLNENHRLVTWR